MDGLGSGGSSAGRCQSPWLLCPLVTLLRPGVFARPCREGAFGHELSNVLAAGLSFLLMTQEALAVRLVGYFGQP